MKLGFVVFIGLPGSGKTTLSKLLKKSYREQTDQNYFFIHLCYDSLIPYSKINHDFQWKFIRNSLVHDIENLVKGLKCKNIELCPLMFREELQDLHCLRDVKVVLVVDDNMYFRSMRYTLYQIAKRNSIGFCQVYLNCPVHLALMKNSERESDSIVPPHVIQNMANKIEPPDKNNNWEKHSLIINAFCDFKDFCLKLFPVLRESLLNCEYDIEDTGTQRQASIIECKKNILHQADLALRKIIGIKVKECLSSIDKSDSQSAILEINQRKHDILNDIKMGNICLTNEIRLAIDQGEEKQHELIKYLSDYF